MVQAERGADDVPRRDVLHPPGRRRLALHDQLVGVRRRRRLASASSRSFCWSSSATTGDSDRCRSRSLAFLVIATVSIAWSFYPGATALGVVTTWLTTIVAAAIATTFTWQEVLRGLGIALRFVLGLSLLFELIVAAVRAATRCCRSGSTTQPATFRSCSTGRATSCSRSSTADASRAWSAMLQPLGFMALLSLIVVLDPARERNGAAGAGHPLDRGRALRRWSSPARRPSGSPWSSWRPRSRPCSWCGGARGRLETRHLRWRRGDSRWSRRRSPAVRAINCSRRSARATTSPAASTSGVP